MDLNEIKELIALMDDAALSEIEVEDSDRRICLKRNLVAPVTAAPVVISAPMDATTGPAGDTQEKEAASNQQLVTSPIVGTFYTSASPTTDQYVALGDLVKKGQVICIVEAMKLMNEIESDVDGRVAKIFLEDGSAVEYGEALFAIEPA